MQDDADADPSVGANDIEFLTFEDVCANHDRGLAEYGQGEPGFLDEHAVRSAAAQQEAAVAGRYLHSFPCGMAAAYLFFLANQQGFINGNKRTAVASCVEFLARNGYRLAVGNRELYEFVIASVGENSPLPYRERLTIAEAWIADRLDTLV